MKILALDTETTGLKNHKLHGHPQVIEFAYIPLQNKLQEIPDSPKELKKLGFVEQFQPSMVIDKRATEVHGKTFRDLIGKRKSEALKLPEETEFIIGHNVQYDHRCLGKPPVKTICTLFLARKLDKRHGLGFKNHKLDNLVIEIIGETNSILLSEVQEHLKNYHSALDDTVLTIILLKQLSKFIPGIATIEELYNFQETLRKV